MNAHEQRMCEMQGECFVLSIEWFPCGSALFVSRFMYSELAKRLDCIDDPYNFTISTKMLESMEASYPGLKRERGTQIPGKVMKWMGYIYRAWSIIKKKQSSWIYKSMKAEQMVALYDSFQTFSPEYCVDQLEQIVLENSGPELSDYEVSRRIRLGE